MSWLKFGYTTMYTDILINSCCSALWFNDWLSLGSCAFRTSRNGAIVPQLFLLDNFTEVE